jgi:hypothetical protein
MYACERQVPKEPQSTEDAIPEDFLLVDIVFDVHYSNCIVSSRTNKTQETDIARVKLVKEAYMLKLKASLTKTLFGSRCLIRRCGDSKKA